MVGRQWGLDVSHRPGKSCWCKTWIVLETIGNQCIYHLDHIRSTHNYTYIYMYTRISVCIYTYMCVLYIYIHDKWSPAPTGRGWSHTQMFKNTANNCEWYILREYHFKHICKSKGKKRAIVRNQDLVWKGSTLWCKLWTRCMKIHVTLQKTAWEARK